MQYIRTGHPNTLANFLEVSVCETKQAIAAFILRNGDGDCKLQSMPVTHDGLQHATARRPLPPYSHDAVPELALLMQTRCCKTCLSAR